MVVARRLRAWRRRVERRASRASRIGAGRATRAGPSTRPPPATSRRRWPSSEEIADDAALAGQADAFSIGDA